MIDLSKVEYLICIVEQSSVSEAADKICISQSALSKNMIALEKEVGAKLYTRVLNKYALTFAGELLVKAYQEEKRMLDSLDGQLGEIHDEQQGSLTLGLPTEMALVHCEQILNLFHAQYPNIRIQLNTEDSHGYQMSVASGETDLAVTADEESVGRRDRKLVLDPIGEYDTLLLLPADHEQARACPTIDWRKRPPIDLARFQGELFTVTQPGTQYYESTAPIFRAYGFTPKASLTLTAKNIFNQFPSAACGLVFVPEWLAECYCRDTDERYFRLDKGKFSSRYAVIYPKNVPMSKPVALMIEILKSIFEKKNIAEND